MTAREDNLRPVPGILDAQNIGANAVAWLVLLGRHAFAARHDAFDAAEVHDHITALEAAYRARENVAGTAFELLEHHVLLDLPDLLQHRLLGRLCRDAPEIGRGDLNLVFLPELDVGIATPGVSQRYLVVLIGNILDHQKLRQCADLAGLTVNFDAEVARRA